MDTESVIEVIIVVNVICFQNGGVHNTKSLKPNQKQKKGKRLKQNQIANDFYFIISLGTLKPAKRFAALVAAGAGLRLTPATAGLTAGA